jgi:hypothetical protein
MPTCADMKVGQVYACQDCGIEIKVIKECTNCATDCADDPCSFVCCKQEMVLKKEAVQKA